MEQQSVRPTQAQEVKTELQEMKRIGMHVPLKALKYCDEHAAELNEFACMRICDIADYVLAVC